MASKPCPTPPGAGPEAAFVPDQACPIRDHEIFTRIVDGDGTPLGSAHRVTTTGPDDQPEFHAATPSVAYDRRNDRFFLAYAAGESRGFSGDLMGMALTADGLPAGPAGRLALRSTADSIAPMSRLQALRGGGFLLAFTWGAALNDRRLYATRLDADGRHGRIHAVAGSTNGIRLAYDDRRERALVAYAYGRSGSERGYARLLRRDGRPLAHAVRFSQVPLGVATDTRGPGWFLTFSEDTPTPATYRFFSRRAGRSGRPTSKRLLAEGPYSVPVIAPLSRGRALVGVDRRLRLLP